MTVVGGSRVIVRSNDFVLLDSLEPRYAEFLSDPPGFGDAPVALDVQVVCGPPPVAAGDIVFDTDSAWIMREDGEGYRLELRRLDAVDPYAVVLCDADTSHAVIHLTGPDGTAPSAGSEVLNPFGYPLDELVFMNHLSSRRAMIVHSAGLQLNVGGEQVGLVFPGASAAGKTTLSMMLVDAGLGAGLLSDDRMILRLGDDGAVGAWGTPWPGDGGFARNERVPLRSLLFLVQSESDAIIPLGADKALRRLMPVVSCPWYDRQRFPDVLETCGRVAAAVPCYELRFTRGGAVADVLARHAAALVSS